MTQNERGTPFPPVDEAEWRRRVDLVLKGADFARKLTARTADGITIQPLYASANGDRPVLARARQGTWTVMQRVDQPQPDAANVQALDDLQGGADGLVLSFAGSTAARGFGLEAETVAALDMALAGVRLDLIALRIDPAPAGRLNAALVAALVEQRGLSPQDLTIDFGLDAIGNFATLGSFSADWPGVSRRVGETVLVLREAGFRGPFLTADGRPANEAGASEAQELCVVLATALAYLRLLESAGVPLDDARRLISFVLAVDVDEFLSIAKLRALRLLWARIEQGCGLTPQPVQLHAETAWRMMTRRDPWTNMLRATVATFSAGIGGADSLTVLPFTSALGLADDFARRAARNTQLLLIEESNLARVADPAAGAGSFEALTDALCAQAWAQFQEIERAGGIVVALERGLVQAAIATVRNERSQAIATRRVPITGTSEFPDIHAQPVAVLAREPAARQARLRMPAGEEAGGRLDFAGLVKAFASGEPRSRFAPAPKAAMLCDPLPSQRFAEPFEALRDIADAITPRPAVFLANLGTIADFTARASFAKNLFEAGGIVALGNDGFADSAGTTDLAALVAAFQASGADLACLCGTDAGYERDAVAAARALVNAGARVYLAGRPAALEQPLADAGVADYVFAGCNVVALLSRVLNRELAA